MTDRSLRSMRVLTIILILTGVWPSGALAQVYRLAELNTEQIRALDREKTVILLPGGIMEQHGPYLPSFADGYFNERVTADLATAIARRPGWAAVIFPVIPLGASGANDVGGKFTFPGTYVIRPETLRAVFMDLATEVGDQGFRWVFLIHAHGAPAHNRALDEAGEYFRDTFGGRMIHLAGLDRGQDPVFDAVLTNAVTKEALAENGLDLHAGLIETSLTMALRPDLVSAAVARAPSLGAREIPDLFRIASRPDWPGYLGAPRYATPDLGRRLIDAESGSLVALALRLLDGQTDERQMPRSADLAQNPAVAKALEPAFQRDAAIAKRQQEWLATRGKR